ncbi:MAG: glycosyltransferase [Clostridiales bacterium]|nr:glycosyltransferase [Clostridiales bacterium]
MRIYQLNTFCGIKSTGKIALEIANLVKEDGGECRIGYGAGDVPPEAAPYAYRIGNPLERKIHGAIRKLFDAEGYGSYHGTQRLIHDIRDFSPDLIHLHNIHGAYLHIPSLFTYLQEAKVPVLWTLHDCWPFTGHCAYFDASGCQQWLSECNHCPSQRQYPVCLGIDGSRRNHRMKKRVLCKPEDMTFVLPCQWLNSHFSRSYLSHYPTRVIYNGVNRDVFHPVESKLRTKYGLKGKKVVLSVASDWDERKGLSYLIEAAQKMGESFTFVLIGLTSAQIEQLPQGMIGLTNTADSMELAAWYSTADCFANPTLEDNMPMVNLEALACGTPVVVFSTGGCPEAVTPECGLIVPKGDLDALCSSIAVVCENNASMRTACVQRAASFDCRSTFQAYLSLYKELCQ